MSGADPDRYASHMSGNGVFGTGIELMIISTIYHRTIRVLNRHGTVIAEYFPESGKEFYVLFSGDPESGHYDAVEIS